LPLPGNGSAEIGGREFSRRQIEGRTHVMAQDLRHPAQHRAIFRLLAQWFQRLTGLNLRRYDHRWFAPREKPHDCANQRQQQSAKENNPQAMLLPEGGRYLGVRWAKGGDVVGGRGVSDSGKYRLGGEQRKGKGQSPKAEVRRPKEGRNPKSE
jgi:hypothetical protein